MLKVALGSVILFATACSGVDSSTSTTTQAATGTNGVYQNGLTTNGVYQNGVYQNGVYQNGVYQNGVYQNGVYQNGVYQNGVYQNGVYQNGVYQNGAYVNGVYQNGVYQNGVYQNGELANGVYQNGIWQSGLWSNPVWQVGTNADALRTNSYTRQFFQYVYACAMPGSFDPSIGLPTDPAAQLAPGKYSTSLDPNNGTLACNTAGACDDPFYTCSPTTHTCVVQLQGAVGVGVNTDGSSWWNSGKCDESCQRWVSACVLARTNAYGVHVEISMRAPADAPQTIKNALAVGDTERTDYPLREGAYYGNVFDTTPVNPQPPGMGSGDPGLLVATPQFYACAGPGSNIPEITKRFCSSQGDQTVIKVPGTCLATGPELATCSSEDIDAGSPTFGAIGDCFTSTDWTGQKPYEEVITVFLKQPISVCGNAVCETGEDTSCPSDCHPGTWAKDFSQSIASKVTQGGAANYISALAADDSIVVAGGTTATVDFGGGPLPASDGYGVLVKFDANGNYVWGVRFGGTIVTNPVNDSFEVGAIFIAPNGTIALAGTSTTSNYTPGIWTGTFSSDGTLSSTHLVQTGAVWLRGLAVDSQGNALLTGDHFGQLNIAGAATDGTQGAFVAKISPDGVAQWAKTVNDAGGIHGKSVAVDSADNVVFLAENSSFEGTIYKICPDGSTGTCAGGTSSWTRSLGTSNSIACVQHFYAIAVDAHDNVYATGNAYYEADLGGGPIASLDAIDQPPVVVKYDRDGNYVWQNVAYIVCAGGGQVCPTANCLDDEYNHGAQLVTGVAIRFADDGTVIVASFGDTEVGGGIDFGTGVFPMYSANDIYIVGYAPDTGATQWAKQIPMIASSSIGALSVDSHDRVIVSGGYAGSLEFDDRMLVTQVPEAPSTVDWFLAAFGAPPPDTTPPVIGQASDSTGTLINTIPQTITLDATSSSGAVAFFMPPTAIDTADAGTNVSCVPPPNTIFPIGTKHVTCTATDARGNASTAGFDIVVKDRLAPTLTGVPADTTSTDAVVTFTPPTATDQVDGDRPVTCIPPSGSTFANGMTTVTCSAADNSGNSIQASFNVTVSGTTDTTPPVVSVPSSITLEATGPTGALATFAASAIDNVDGSVPATCSPASGSVFPLGSTTVTCTARDTAGNIGTASFAINVSDTTAPTLVVPANPLAEATSQSGASVTYATSAPDLVDGARPVTCSPASGATFALGVTTVNCNTSDTRGNTRTATFTVTVADTTPPIITVPSNISAAATGASGAAVTYTSSAIDAIDGTVATTCTPASGSTFAIGTTTVTCSAHDAHDNTASNSFTVTVSDTTAPVITVPANISVAATTASGAPVSFTTSATDAVDGTVATSCTKTSGSTFVLGTTTVTCSAHDSHNNSTSQSFIVAVQMSMAALLAPINTDGSSEFKLGSIVPVRFSLTGASASVTNAVATVTLTKTSSTITGTHHKLPRYALPTSGTTAKYNSLLQHYYFRYDTSGLSAGTYTVNVDFHDGAVHTAQVSLGTFGCPTCENDGGDD